MIVIGNVLWKFQGEKMTLDWGSGNQASIWPGRWRMGRMRIEPKGGNYKLKGKRIRDTHFVFSLRFAQTRLLRVKGGVRNLKAWLSQRGRAQERVILKTRAMGFRSCCRTSAPRRHTSRIHTCRCSGKHTPQGRASKISPVLRGQKSQTFDI